MSAAVVRAAQQRCRILPASLPAVHCGAQAPAEGADCAPVGTVSGAGGLRHVLLRLPCQSGGQGKACIVHSVGGKHQDHSEQSKGEGKPRRASPDRSGCSLLWLTVGQAPHGPCGLGPVQYLLGRATWLWSQTC